MSEEMGKLLNTMLSDLLKEEVIGGTSIADVLDCVDLDVAFSPIIQNPLVNDWGDMNEVEVTKWPDGRYAIVQTDPPDFEVIDEGNMKIMRARYLLHSKARQRRHVGSHRGEQA